MRTVLPAELLHRHAPLMTDSELNTFAAWAVGQEQTYEIKQKLANVRREQYMRKQLDADINQSRESNHNRSV